MLIRNLHADWKVKQADPAWSPEQQMSPEGWLNAVVPGTIHQDLMAAGVIEDPFLGFNENDVQWVGEKAWLYHLDFEADADMLVHPYIDLCFDGLDTVASVWLNGTHVLESSNMFVPRRVPVCDVLRIGMNRLDVLFKSALLYGKEQEGIYSARVGWNGDMSRVFVRKAQYHYGWDWGPVLMTCGMWRPVRLEMYDARISDLYAPVEIDDLTRAVVRARVMIEGAEPGDHVEFTLIDPNGREVETVDEIVAGDAAAHTFEVEAPQLWYPNGYGAQPLYTIKALLIRDLHIIDDAEKRIGLRKLRLVQEPVSGEAGTSFYFEINEVPVFGGGANWIPADLLVPRVADDTYRRWIQAAADAHMVMLRVWGGGIYEQNVFYDLCDELGLMVWQDFMFACGLYPAHFEFQTNVRVEAETNVRRLRHHPSLVIWSGNNEDYQLAGSFGLYDVNFEGDFTQTQFPGRELYEVLLPGVCAELDTTRPYWRASPYGGADVNDATVGDRHTWEIWHGSAAPYQRYGDYAGRFVSEFGMQGYPSRAALEQYDSSYPPSTEARLHHNKAPIGEDRIRKYIDDNIPFGTTFEDYAYASQIIQGEAMAYAYRAFRGQWGTPGARDVGGALVWQLNDCWAVTSWALIDGTLTPKPAYYTVKRELAPVAVDGIRESDGVLLWAINATGEYLPVQVILTTWGIDGTVIQQQTHSVELMPYAVTALLPEPMQVGSDHIVAARLLVDGAVVSRVALFPEPFKDHPLADPELTLTPLNNGRVRVTVRRPAKAVLLSADRAVFDDNLIDMMPDDPQNIGVLGAETSAVRARSLFDLQT